MRALRLLLVPLAAACSSAPPPPPAPGAAALALGAPTVVPLLESPLPVVEVRLDGRVLPFLVDSGAGLSIVDPRRAAALGLELRPFAEATSTRGTSGKSTAIDHYVPVERLELGALVLEHTHLAALDDDVLRIGVHAGILGQDLLARLVLVFDVERRALHVLPARDRAGVQAYLKEADLGAGAWAVVQADFRPSPFLALDLPAVPDGCDIEIDTGATDTSFPEPVIAALELPETAAGAIELRGVGGTRTSRAYLLEDFGMFGFRVTNDVYANQLEYALLGMDVLGEFVLVLDGPGKTLWLHHREVEPDTSVMPVEGEGR